MVLLSLGVRVCYGKYCPGQVSTPNLRPSSGVDTATVVVSDPRPAVANDDRLIFILPLSSALSSALLWLSLTNRVQIQTHMYVNYLIYSLNHCCNVFSVLESVTCCSILPRPNF